MSTAAATSGPASDPRPASSAPATNRTPSERSKRNSRAALRRRRFAAARRDPVGLAGVPLEEADLVDRPVREEGLSYDPVAGDGPPVAAVVASSTVVAHHEVMVRRNGDAFREIAASESGAGLDEVLFGLHSVDHRASALDRKGVSRPGDDPLDEVRVRALIGRLGAGLGLGVLDPALVALVGAERRVKHD